MTFKKRNTVLFIYILLALITLIVYSQAILNDFVGFDDNEYITENHHVKNGLSLESVAWAFTTFSKSNWHPLTWLSHMFDCELFDMNPAWHHITNLLLHIANTLLLFAVLKKMTGSLWASAFVAAAFAFHPLHVESVAWVAERKDVLSTFFWLLTTLAYMRYAEKPCIKRYLPVPVLFALGLMAKPMLVTLPFVLLLMDYWPLRRVESAGIFGIKNDYSAQVACYKRKAPLKLILEKVPLFVLVIASSIVTYIAQEKGGSVQFTGMVGIGLRISNALVSYVAYLIKFVYPVSLAALYPFPFEGVSLWKTFGALLLLVVVTATAIVSARNRPWLAVGWLWYLGTLVPVIGFVQVGVQAMADRYTYVPSIGIFIIAAWAGAEVFKRSAYRKKILAVIAAIVLGGFMIMTQTQLKYWQDSLTLFERAVKVTENNYVMHNNFANALLQNGRKDEAMYHYEQALKINPGHLSARANIGMMLHESGKIDEAISELHEALSVDPDYPPALYHMGAALVKKEDYEQSVYYLEKALKAKPDWAEAHNLLAGAYYYQRKLNEAADECLKCLSLEPGHITARLNLARTYFQMGKKQQAVEQYEYVLDIDKKNLSAMYELVWILAADEDGAIRDPGKAVSLAKALYDLRGRDDPDLLDTLAAAYASEGSFDKAVETAQKAIDIAASKNNKELENGIRERLRLYQSQKPYRRTPPENADHVP